MDLIKFDGNGKRFLQDEYIQMAEEQEEEVLIHLEKFLYYQIKDLPKEKDLKK